MSMEKLSNERLIEIVRGLKDEHVNEVAKRFQGCLELMAKPERFNWKADVEPLLQEKKKLVASSRKKR